MSTFPTAKIKRFNEVDDKNIPPVGTYDIANKKGEIASSFDKAERFKKPLGCRVRSKDSLSDVSVRSRSNTPLSTPSKDEKKQEVRSARRIDSLSCELKELQSQMELVVAENNYLKQVNENLSAKINSFEKSASRSQTEHGNVEECVSYDISNYNLERENSLEVTCLRKEIRCVREELEFKAIKLDTIEKDAQKNENDLNQQLQEAINAFNNSMEVTKFILESRINKVGDRINKVGDRINKVGDKIKMASANLKEAEILKSHLTEAKIENLHLKDRLQVELKNIEDNSGSIEALTNKLAILENEKILLIKSNETVVVNLQHEIENFQRNENKLKTNLQIEIDLHENMKQSLELKNEELAHVEFRLKDEIKRGKDLSDDLNSLRQTLQINSEEADNLRCENSGLLLQLNETKERHSLTLKTLEGMRQTIEDFKVTEMNLNDRINREILNCASADLALSIELEKRDNAIKDLEIEKGAQIQAEKVLKKEVEFLQKSLVDVNCKFAIARNEISALNGKDEEIENLKINLVEMTVQQSYNKEIIDDLTNNLSQKEEELTQFQDVISKNHQLMSFKDSLIQDLENCHEKLSAACQANVELLKTVDNHTVNISQLENHICELLSQSSSQSSNLLNLKERETELLLQIDVLEDKLNFVQQDSAKSVKAAQQKLFKTEKELKSYQEKEKNSAHNETLMKLTADHAAQITAMTEEQQNFKEEIQKWRSLYEQLKEKIAPFQTQLDAYEIEKHVLESSSKEAKHKLKKMGDELATLVGHHNQRQRIHYVNKLKDDCFQLKEENTKLWAEVLKFRKQFAHSTPSKVSKFDPKQAFKHAKENEGIPLKDSNRK